MIHSCFTIFLMFMLCLQLPTTMWFAMPGVRRSLSFLQTMARTRFQPEQLPWPLARETTTIPLMSSRHNPRFEPVLANPSVQITNDRYSRQRWWEWIPAKILRYWKWMSKIQQFCNRFRWEPPRVSRVGKLCHIAYCILRLFLPVLFILESSSSSVVVRLESRATCLGHWKSIWFGSYFDGRYH